MDRLLFIHARARGELTPPMVEAAHPASPSVLRLGQLCSGPSGTVQTWLATTRGTPGGPGAREFPDWSVVFEGTCPGAARGLHAALPLERGALGWAICRTCDMGWRAAPHQQDPELAGRLLVMLYAHMLAAGVWRAEWGIDAEGPTSADGDLHWIGEVPGPYAPGRVQQFLLDPAAVEIDSQVDHVATELGESLRVVR